MLIIVTSTIERNFMTDCVVTNYKVINIINLVQHFLDYITVTQLAVV